jgi:hypothetical protein
MSPRHPISADSLAIAEQETAISKQESQRAAFATLQKVVDLTTELFGDNTTVKSDYDPAFPDDKYTVFVVDVAGGPARAAQLEEEWSRRVNALVQGVDSFRLSIRLVP